ncbi:proton-dependent oligopeptide transporter, POT family [Trypanosoma cruzi]|nr:proton-dependent oligopeptide transporter, POT family [Trypanosoma cruzi]
MLLGFPSEVWITMTVEFAERLGFYGTTFMLMTYCTIMLRWSTSAGNALINALYALTPLSACVSSSVSDGRWGRPYSLVVFLTTYAVGLSMVALSSFPLMYGEFPLDPSVLGVALFATGILLFALGYGGMKVCTNPLMADCVSDAYKDNETQCQVVLSQLFRWIYAITNSGSLIGIIVPPLLRSLDGRSVVMGSVTHTTGYYFGFSLSAVSSILGLSLFVMMYHRFRRNEPSPSTVLLRTFLRAIFIRWCFAVGRIRDEAFLSAHRWDLIDFAGYSVTAKKSTDTVASHDALSGAPDLSVKLRNCTESGSSGELNHGREAVATEWNVNEAKQDDMPSQGAPIDADGLDQNWVDNAKMIASVCRALVAMPIYWLITNQFSTNMILQAATTGLPSYIPPEVFNNVNVISLLISLLLFDRVVFPFVFVNKTPPVRGRVVCGFATMIISMFWCGVVQINIDHRGKYDEKDIYHLLPGMTMVSPLWLVPPYIMQGVASALVDTTIMEVVYVAAPTSMKGTMMAFYLMASSLSGFLGLALSPAMRPKNAQIVIFSLTGALVLVTVLFYLLNSPTAEAVTEAGDGQGTDVAADPHTVSKEEKECLLLKGFSRSENAAYYGGVLHHREASHL